MNLTKYIFLFLLVGIFVLPSQVLAKGSDNKNRKVLTLKEAEKMSTEAVAKYSHKKAELFSCTLIEEKEKEWILGCEGTEPNRPVASGPIVKVQKKNGKVEIEPGM